MKRSKVLLVQRPDLRRKQDPDQPGHNQPAGERQPRPFRPTHSQFATPSPRVRREPQRPRRDTQRTFRHEKRQLPKVRKNTNSDDSPVTEESPNPARQLSFPGRNSTNPRGPPFAPTGEPPNPEKRRTILFWNCFGPNEGEQWQSQQWPAIRRSKISPPT